MPVSDLPDHTGFWLRMVSNAVSQDFARRVAGQGVTVAEWALLRVLHDAPAMAPSVLADRMGMTRGAISKLSDRLLAKGLLARTDDPADRRAHALSLTDAGRALVPVLAALADANDADYFAVLPADDRTMLDRILRDLAARKRLTAPPLD